MRFARLCDTEFDAALPVRYTANAGWSSLVARRAHNPKVVSSNLTPATNLLFVFRAFGTLPEALFVLGQVKGKEFCIARSQLSVLGVCTESFEILCAAVVTFLPRLKGAESGKSVQMHAARSRVEFLHPMDIERTVIPLV